MAKTSRRSTGAPLRAMLLASLPPDVNTTMGAMTPTAPATASRDSSSSLRAALPSAWTEEALPVRSKARSIAAFASGRSGLVALWSR